jgi:hypothetical protein
MSYMRLRALLSQICLVAILLAVVAFPSATWAHEGHGHAGEHAAISGSAPQPETPAHAFAGPGEGKSVVLSRTSGLPDPACDGACCGTGCCGACTMALAEDVSQVMPAIGAGIRVPPPSGVAGPGTIPEALPKPPKSFA